MKHIAGWFRRNNLIMLQAQNLAKRLQEAWDNAEDAERLYINECATNAGLQTDIDYLREQLHRVARERDQERNLRLETYVVCHDAMNQIGAERSLRLALEEHYDELLDEERRLRLAAEDALLDKYMVDKTWEEMTKEIHDTYLEELENEEE